jgi:hypothetical protein
MSDSPPLAAASDAAALVALVTRFLAQSLPRNEWTHEAHLAVGLWHVRRFGPAAALPLLRHRISRYNEVLGGVNDANSGYHETITAFYVDLIGRCVAATATTEPWLSDADLARDLIARHGARDLPHRHWSPERLDSPAARLAWREPDREPL